MATGAAPAAPQDDLTARVLALLALLSRDRLMALTVLLLGGLGIGLLWTGVRRARQRRNAPAPRPQSSVLPAGAVARVQPSRPRVAKARTVAAAEAALQAACAVNDATGAHRAFLDWLGFMPPAKGPVQPSLAGPLSTSEMAAGVEALCAHLYGGAATPWQGRSFMAAWRLEKRARQRSQKTIRRARLAPLYPAA